MPKLRPEPCLEIRNVPSDAFVCVAPLSVAERLIPKQEIGRTPGLVYGFVPTMRLFGEPYNAVDVIIVRERFPRYCVCCYFNLAWEMTEPMRVYVRAPDIGAFTTEVDLRDWSLLPSALPVTLVLKNDGIYR